MLKTVGDLKKELEKFSDDTPLVFQIGDECEFLSTSQVYQGERGATFYFLIDDPEFTNAM